MEFKCLPNTYNCGSSCCKELTTYVNIEDINRWIDEDRQEIITCLTWHRVKGREPQDMLFIPKKKHLINHSFLKKFYKKKWEKDNGCIFLRNNRCQIYKTCPTACKEFPKGKLDFNCPGLKEVTEKDKKIGEEMAKERRLDNLAIYHNRELLSKMIKKSKEEVDLKKLAKLFGYESKI